MAKQYHPFPWRGFFRTGFLLLSVALIPGAPLAWHLFFYDYFVKTSSALNDSSYRDTPGRAQAATWHIDSWWPWVLAGAVAWFLIYRFWIYRWAGPKRDPHKSSYS